MTVARGHSNLPRLERLYFRARDGSRVGPVAPQWVEILYDARLVDGETPLSATGRTWQPLKAWPALVDRIRANRGAWNQGVNPWGQLAPRPAPPDSDRNDLLATASTVLAKMLTLATHRAHGLLEVETVPALRFDFRDGKIVQVESDDANALMRRLLDRSVVSADALGRAESMALSSGTDVATALVTSGAVAPDVFLRELDAWGRDCIAEVIAVSDVPVRFDPNRLRSPAMPLSFDRFSIYLETIRTKSRGELGEKLRPHRKRPIILSWTEELQTEQLKLVPMELRVLQMVNGVRTLADLSRELGQDDERTRSVLQMVYFLTESGLASLGRDPEQEADLAAAESMRQRMAKWAKGTHYDLLGLSAQCSDEDVNLRYAELAKEIHPDVLRPDAAPELKDAYQEAFALLNEAYRALETEEARIEYSNALEEGRAGSSQDLEKAQQALRAETSFKKAEVLVRVKKFQEAATYIREATELAPDDKEFQIFQIYIEYLVAHGSSRDAAAAESAAQRILQTMKFDATLANGYLYLAHLYRDSGKADLSLRYFEKVLEFDENHPEATREVRLARARKEREKKKKKKWL